MGNKIHPQIIMKGWREARKVAQKVLEEISVDNFQDKEAFRNDLKNLALTTLSSKLLLHDRERFAELCVNAVMRLQGSGNLDYIKLIKKPGGTLGDSFLADGFILEKWISTGCKKVVTNPKIMVANTPLDHDKIKIMGSKVKIDRILAYKPDVFINRQLIYNYPEQLLQQAGVCVIEHADFDGVERLAAVLGSEILSTFDRVDPEVLGSCTQIEEIMIGEDKVIKFSGCNQNAACTTVLRGSGQHILDEAERSLHDAICVLVAACKNHRCILGGGNSEMRMSLAVDELAKTLSGKQALAVEAFAKALLQLPTII